MKYYTVEIKCKSGWCGSALVGGDYCSIKAAETALIDKIESKLCGMAELHEYRIVEIRKTVTHKVVRKYKEKQ